MNHSHMHDHAPIGYGRAFAIGVTLNLGFVLIEAYFGWQADSLALLADAGHNLGDVGGLLLAWAAFAAAKRRPDSRHTYGWRRASILASFANAVLLWLAMGALAWEAMGRLSQPTAIDASLVMRVAAAGVVINALTAWLFFSGRQHDLNLRGAFLHMAADALVSVGVVLAGALYLWQGWQWIDPVMSLLIALVIVMGTWSLFRQSLHLLFDGVPDHLDLFAIEQALRALPAVLDVHDLHVWAISTTDSALTAHLVIDPHMTPADGILQHATHLLNTTFSIQHSTLQCETVDFSQQCAARNHCMTPSLPPQTHDHQHAH
jgi:cobalt-zinc-cadmium efflux system protein